MLFRSVSQSRYHTYYIYGIIFFTGICRAFIGHVIDMNEKKRMLLWCTSGYYLLIAFLLIPAFYASNLHFTGHEITYYIYGIIFFTGICRAFIGPIVPVMIPKIVGQEKLANAITLNQATFLQALRALCTCCVRFWGHLLGSFQSNWLSD